MFESMKKITDEMTKQREESLKKFNARFPPTFEREVSFSGESYTCGFWKNYGNDGYYWALKRKNGYHEHELQYVPVGLLDALIELKEK